MQFSIVIPVYNTERYLARCLDSLVAQTDGDFEAIVVDDGSGAAGSSNPPYRDAVGVDGGSGAARVVWADLRAARSRAEEIVARYDARFRYVRHEENRGLFQARMTGLKAARGEYVIPLDSDDYVQPGLLAALLRLRPSPSSLPDVIVFQMLVEAAGTRTLAGVRYGNRRLSGAAGARRLLGGKIQCAICGKAVRREVYLKAMEDLAVPADLYLNSSEDLLQSLPVMLSARTVVTLAYPGYCHCWHDGSLTTALGDPERMDAAAKNSSQVFAALTAFLRKRADAADWLTRLESFRRQTVRWYFASLRPLPEARRQPAEAALFRHFDPALLRAPPAVCAKIANLGLLMALLVVARHVPWQPHAPWGKAAVFAVRGLAFAVAPFFFAASGYFLAAHTLRRGWWQAALKKRVRTLLVPYLVWTTVEVLVVLATSGRWTFGWGAYGFDLTHPPLVIPLWFMRALMLLMLVGPVLKRLVDRRPVLTLAGLWLATALTAVAFGCGWLDAERGLGGALAYSLPAEGAFYFSLGIWLQNVGGVSVSRKAQFALTAVGLALAGLRVFCDLRGIPLRFYPGAFETPFVLAALWMLAPARPWPQGLTRLMFPIYVLHALPLSVFWECGMPRGTLGPWVVFAVATLAPVAIACALRRFCPRVASTVFGGR